MSSDDKLRCLNPRCKREITRREKRLNAGLCNSCFQDACRETARRIRESGSSE